MHIYNIIAQYNKSPPTSAGNFDVGSGDVSNDGRGRLTALPVHPLGGGRGYALLLPLSAPVLTQTLPLHLKLPEHNQIIKMYIQKYRKSIGTKKEFLKAKKKIKF